jgi:uncharacterized protein YukJ
MSTNPNQTYSVIKFKPLQGIPWNYEKSFPNAKVRQGYQHASPHYHIIGEIDSGEQYTIVINVESKDSNSPMLLYYIDDDYKNEITSKLNDTFHNGYSIVEPICESNGISLDYVKGNLFDHTKMVTECYLQDGEDSLNGIIDKYIKNAIEDGADIYAFGMEFSDEGEDSGVHDIHMNQGNEAKWADEDHCYQDGGILMFYPSENRCVAMFFAFKSQSFHTDEYGHRID